MGAATSEASVKPGARIRARDAKVIEREFGRIIERRGALSADAVVDAARAPASPLHRHFEWNDAKAGHAYRLAQARYLIRSITITRVDDRGEAVKVRAIQHVPEVGYLPTDTVLQNADHTANLLRRFRAEAKALHQRWQAFRHLAGVPVVLDAIESVMAEAAE